MRSETLRNSHTPTSVVDAGGRRFGALQALIRESKRLVHEPVEVELLHETVLLKLANGGSRPSDAVLLRQSTLMGKWDRSEKTMDLCVGNLIGHLPNHDPSKKVTALFRIDVCFFSKEPVAFWVEIDSAHWIEENSIAYVESIAIWPLGTFGRNENPPVVGRMTESLPVPTDRESITMMKRKEDLAFIAHALDILQPIQREGLESRLRPPMDC